MSSWPEFHPIDEDCEKSIHSSTTKRFLRDIFQQSSNTNCIFFFLSSITRQTSKSVLNIEDSVLQSLVTWLQEEEETTL